MRKLDQDLYSKFEKEYYDNKYNSIIANAISNVGLKDASLNKHVINKHDFVFSNEVEIQEITDQKRTGRCWMFAGLNMIRPHIANKLKIEDFELSENYLYFYDNMEKTNLFLQRIIDTRDKEISDRQVEDIFHNPPEDGGNFEFFYYLIKKYGICPKSAMNETFHSEDSFTMFYLLEKSLKKTAIEIRKESSLEKIEELREKALYNAYNIFVKCLGNPVKEFDFKYYDKDDKFKIEPNMTPISFFQKYIDDFFDNKVRLINDPRREYNKIIVDKFSKNAVDLPDLEAINVDMDTISKACQKSIKDNQSLWFSCDIDIDEDSKSGVLDENLYNYNQTFVDINGFTKAERIDSRFTCACHAMNLIGYDKKKNSVNFWKIENSWGDESGKKGFFSMTDTWFRENTFEVIVDKKYLTKKTLKAFEKKKIEYGQFDPLFKMLRNIK